MVKRIVLIILGLVVLTGCVVEMRLPAAEPPTFTVRPVTVLITDFTDLYYVPNTTIFLYHGSWYYFCEGAWFASVNYKGPWEYIEKRNLPPALIRIPPGHLRTRTPPGHRKKITPPGHYKPKKIPPGHRKKR